MCLLLCSDRFFRFRRCTKRVGEADQRVGLGWTSDIVNVHVDALWKALEMKARSSKEFTDVSEVKASDQDGYLIRSVTIKATRS